MTNINQFLRYDTLMYRYLDLCSVKRPSHAELEEMEVLSRTVRYLRLTYAKEIALGEKELREENEK